MTNHSHPSTTEADVETASDNYAGRFASPSGQWMLKLQEELTRALIPCCESPTLLDVGGGHGQLARPFAESGYNVTVTGSDSRCMLRIADLVASGKCRFVEAPSRSLPFEDKSFDVVLCFRLVMHCEEWPDLIRELCRVARKAVIIDYPTRCSLNAVAPLLFGAKRKIEKNTRHWELFSHKQIRKAFLDAGFIPNGRRGQFFLPMVLHRAINRPTLSRRLERVCGALGLHALLGSPVIIRMTPLSLPACQDR